MKASHRIPRAHRPPSLWIVRGFVREPISPAHAKSELWGTRERRFAHHAGHESDKLHAPKTRRAPSAPSRPLPFPPPSPTLASPAARARAPRPPGPSSVVVGGVAKAPQVIVPPRTFDGVVHFGKIVDPPHYRIWTLGPGRAGERRVSKDGQHGPPARQQVCRKRLLEKQIL